MYLKVTADGYIIRLKQLCKDHDPEHGPFVERFAEMLCLPLLALMDCPDWSVVFMQCAEI